MSRGAYTKYSEPFPPERWGRQEREYHNQLMGLFDQIFAWRGRLKADDLLPLERQKLALAAWPVGSVLETRNTDPRDTLGGTWEPLTEGEETTRWVRVG